MEWGLDAGKTEERTTKASEAPPSHWKISQMEDVRSITLELRSGYAFDVDFELPNVPRLSTDASPPLGEGKGPDSEMLLMAAVGNCLAASLAFSLRKYKNDQVAIRATVQGQLARNDRGRLRVQGIAVEIRLGVPASGVRLLQRALEQYEDFCVVTQSVRSAIPVSVRVFDSEGAEVSAALS
ncbi:MAG: OsmC family protein [Proteobacteria bacterium]|nr:OsmC family protein [Pseudomonadota bacterium]